MLPPTNRPQKHKNEKNKPSMNFGLSRGGRWSKKGSTLTPYPHQAGPKIPSWVNVRKKVFRLQSMYCLVFSVSSQFGVALFGEETTQCARPIIESGTYRAASRHPYLRHTPISEKKLTKIIHTILSFCWLLLDSQSQQSVFKWAKFTDLIRKTLNQSWKFPKLSL
jgi:hypothetical protein